MAEDNPFMHDGIDSNFELEVCKEVTHGTEPLQAVCFPLDTKKQGLIEKDSSPNT